MFEKWKQKKEQLPQVDIITQWDKGTDEFYAPGALVRVKNGRNLLGAKFSEEQQEATYYTLMLGDKPLFQLEGAEYYCPTCEKIVRSGYHLEQTEEFCVEKLNQENIPFTDALEEIIPLLGLLMDKYYVILDTELYPTDGNGHLFWNVPNSDKCLPGSCTYYMGDGEWGLSRPHFTIATQSVEKLNKERVDYYREHSGCRAIAYYMDGYMTALVDGHHKAMAAALEHKKVNALVIIPCYTCNYRQDDGSYKAYICTDEMRFSCEEYGLENITNHEGEKISFEEMKLIQTQMPRTILHVPYDNDELVSYYPNVHEMAYIDAVGEITDEWLDQIVSEKYICKYEEVGPLIKAVGGLRHDRLWEIADYFLMKASYFSLLNIHDTDMIITLVEELLKVPPSEALEKYLIDIMVKYEEEYPAVRDMIIDYL